ncbi:MAG: hypothetical protein HKN93_11255 [Acidimicrobiia bacterium]|nr:hypothetical protein [Acidimicrobiia bacterium]
MRLARFVIAIAILTGACTSDTPTPSTTTQPATTTSTVAPSTSPCVAGDIPFETEGTVALFGEADGDAGVIGGVRWAGYGECERLVIDLLTTDGSPGSLVGEGAAVFVSAHILRVEFPDAVIDTAVGQFSTAGMATTGYVVHDSDGGFFIDIHLGQPADVRVFDLDAPARVVVDLLPRSGELDTDSAPLTGAGVVVATWTNESPRAIAGYATTSEVVVGSGDAFTTIAVASFPGSWGSFTATVPEGVAVDIATPDGEGVTLP